MLHALILAGGSGKRFWPLSRRTTPKQLLRIASEATMIEETVARMSGLVPPSRVHVLTNASTVAPIRKLLRRVPPEQVVGEPEGRDTAAAIGLGAVLAAKRDPDAVVAVLPADHVIRPAAAFRTSIAAAAAAAKSGGLFVFGVAPDHPATGYGYIRRGRRVGASRGVPLFRVARFVEKPDAKTARRYLADGDYLWNSGVFCWRADAILSALRRFRPGVAAPLDRIAAAGASPAALTREFHKAERISIDYAVLENSPDVRMIAADWHWDDVGSWTSVAAYVRADGRGNRARGKYFGLDSENCLVLTDGHLVGTVGVKDLVIVRTHDATLVCHRDRAQDVKKLVDLLEAAGEEHVL
jgi:mannose-1-phosphate guanylyltransferase